MIVILFKLIKIQQAFGTSIILKYCILNVLCFFFTYVTNLINNDFNILSIGFITNVPDRKFDKIDDDPEAI